MSWSLFWSAAEAVGTISAVIVALWFGLRELQQARKRNTQQVRSIRTLLMLEIESNLEPMKSLLEQGCQKAEESGKEGIHHLLVYRDTMVVHRRIVDQLGQQLDLFSRALTPSQIESVDNLYREMEGIRQLQGDLRSLWNDRHVSTEVTERVGDVNEEDTIGRISEVVTHGNQVLGLLK